MSGGFGAGGDSSGRAQQGLRVLDEAVRLLDLLQGEQRAHAAASGPERSASCPDTDGAEAHRGGECWVCPVCRGLAALREANPEAVSRMTRAVADLATALGDLVTGPDRAEPRQPQGEAETGHRWYATDEARATSRVAMQRIDVTE